MPLPGKRWYHVTFGTHNSWLPGDPRGFRARNHEIHSSGDHRNPPPQGEHAGLHRHARSLSGEPIHLPPSCRAIAGQAIVQNLAKHDHELLIIAVGAMHTHLLAKLPSEKQPAEDAVGFAKLSASMRLTERYPGKVWARGCGLKPIRDEQHQRNTYRYIRRHIEEGAWAWTFREGVIERDM